MGSSIAREAADEEGLADRLPLILALNGGSSSLKAGIFQLSGDSPDEQKRFNFPNSGGNVRGALENLKTLLAELRSADDAEAICAVSHRVVHGGSELESPIVVDDAAMVALTSLAPLAPLHQPLNLELIGACREALPGVPQIACFDTAFHRDLPLIARLYAIPVEMSDEGVQVYGFHGISYDYVWRQLKIRDPDVTDKRVIIAHLGAGASLCAIAGGRSIATTMGFSPADGLPMATRTGSIDPGVLIYLMREKGWTADDLEYLVYKGGGLKGVSGESGDMRALRKSGSARAVLAIELFVYRIVRSIGSLAAALGGLDVLAFTGGIGEHDEKTRKAICSGISWLPGRPDVLVVPTDEERMLATYAADMLDEVR